MFPTVFLIIFPLAPPESHLGPGFPSLSCFSLDASPLILVSFKDNVSCHWNIVFQMLIFKHMSVGGFGLRNSCLSEPSKPPKYGRLGQEIPKYCCSHEIVTVSKTKKKGHTENQRAFKNYTSGTVWFQTPFFCISILERLGMQLTSSPSLTDG